MESPDPVSKSSVRRLVHAEQPHCADHAQFRSDCAVCKKALANVQPYPLQKSKPVVRSFGFTDEITEAKLRALDPKFGDVRAGDPGYGLSFVVFRVLRRLIWPF